MLSPDQMEEIRRRLLIFFHGHHELVEQYLREFGPSIQIKNIQTLRARQSETQPSRNHSEGQESPIYTIFLECPCCRTREIPHRELRASAMSIRHDPFMAPVYFPVGKFQALNYLTVSVAVCPKCLFASPDKKDFVQFNKSSKQTIPSRLSLGIIAELQDTLAERQYLVEQARCGTDFQALPRSYPLAVLSYRLADQRARIEQENKIPYAILKRAGYHTRIALLQRQSGEEDSEALQQALDLYKEAYFRTDFPSPTSEFQSCFVIFSIYLKQGLLKEARDYITAMEQSKKRFEEQNDTAALQALNQWLGMAKARWEDRDDPRIWETPGLA